LLTRYIALVSETKKIGMAELAATAAALQKQVTRDFGPIWGVAANMGAYARLEDVPLDYWPIIVSEDVDRPEAAGYHEDELGQPRAFVLPEDDWTVTASHEMLEMLADPWGRHLVAGPWPDRGTHRVKFLVEVCDPCSNKKYKVNGIKVSDFYTPHFFDPEETSGVRYSYTGAITAPRKVLEGGYLTWYDPTSGEWWHRAWYNTPKPEDKKIPTPPIVRGNVGNIRAVIDRHVSKARASKRG
jgi:hypothetical protein